MKHYTDEDVRQVMHALLNYEPATPRGVIPETKGAATFVLDVIAPAIAARALREAAKVVDSEVDWSGGRHNYGDNDGYETSARILRTRADEIEDQP